MSGQTLISIDEVCRRVGLHKATIYRHMRAGRFPRSRVLGPTCVRWLASEIDEWIAALPTSDGPTEAPPAAQARPSARRPIPAQ